MKRSMAMKYVVDSINLKVIQVPDDYIECSVCYKWMPKSSYCIEHGVQTRTNCDECYHLKHEVLIALQKKNRDFVSANWRSSKMYKLDRERAALDNAVTKEELITMFNEAMSKIPAGAKICMAEYSNDNFDQPVEDYMLPYFDPTLKFGGKVWVL